MNRFPLHLFGMDQSSLLGHVLHIGAGLCDALPDYLAAGSDAVMLVEPDPDTALILRAQTTAYPHVSVRENAVSANTEKQLLHRFSFANLNSLRTPIGLMNLFPGLDSFGQHPVQVLDPADFVRALNLPDTANHMLVLEAPGEAMGILQALDAAGLLDGFRYLRICEGREALYEGATPLADIRTWLATRFFDKDSVYDESDPGQPVLSLTYNLLATQKVQYENKISAIQTALTDAKAQIETHQQENVRLQKENAGIAVQLEDLLDNRPATKPITPNKALLKKDQ